MADDQQHEGARAKAWRRAQRMSRRELAERTGYGLSTVNAIERGAWASGKAVDESTMRTYRLACAAVALGVAFDWQTLELHPLRVVIRVPGPSEPATDSRPPETV